MGSSLSINPSLLYRLFSKTHLYCTMPVHENVLFLTFDDGPEPQVTPEVLKILKEHDARATFFCTGENVKRNPELFSLIVKDGHAIGNHTFSHLDGWKTPPGEYMENISRCDELFVSDLFRPPYGRFSLSQYFLVRKKYKFIMWSVMSRDFHHGTTPRKCLSNVLENAGPGSIIVYHDTLAAKEKLLYSLPLVLDHFREKGFRFGKIEFSPQ